MREELLIGITRSFFFMR